MENSNLTPEQLAAVHSILGDKKENMEYIEVEVPTKCKWYETDSITIRPFTFRDEKAVLSPINKNKNFMNYILERCIKGIDVDSLFLIDRNYLIYKLKEISTGSEINMGITCEMCSREGNLEIDLNILKVNNLEGEIPITLKLEEINKEIKIFPPRVRQEEYLLNFDILCKNIWRFIPEVDGIKESAVISAVMDRLPIKDMHSILKIIGMQGYGLQNEINYLCGCGAEQVVEIPLTENFFGDS